MVGFRQVFVSLDCADPGPLAEFWAAMLGEAERLGARPAPEQPAPEHRRVLLDPAGHPFCLTTQVPREAR